MEPDHPPRTIDLAQAPVFSLGAVEVRPATLEVIAGERREQLEPRIMQVLTALARKRGEVLSRDELIATCWGGRIVGDDSINRCIFRLRKLAEQVGGFTIETVPRVGFRLTPHGTALTSRPLAGDDVVLAVLPFDNLSADPDMTYFSDGVSEEILHTVARHTDLKVIGRSSSFRFRGEDKSARHVAQALGASHVLDGSVRRSGPAIRITVQLIECARQTSIWSERFDRDLTDILALQDSIAAAVATALQARFVRASPVPKIDPTAYDLYVRTRPAPGSPHIPPARLIGLLESVVSLAPDFAPAWGNLAHERVVVYRRMDLGGTTVSRADVISAADRALDLDPDNGGAHTARGHLLAWNDYAGRQALFEKAFVASGAMTEVRAELGWFLTSVGRNQDALDRATEDLARDPFALRGATLYGQLLCGVGRYDECRRAYAEFRNRWPDVAQFMAFPLVAAAAVGDLAEVERLQLLARQAANTGALQRSASLADPSPERKDRVLARLHAQVRKVGAPELSLLTLAHQMGLHDETFEIVDAAAFDRILSQDAPWPYGALSAGVIFDRTTNLKMIEDPRFVRLCAKLGLCEYWMQTERWPDCAAYVGYDFKAECAVA